MPGTYEGQKGAQDPLELELWTEMSWTIESGFPGKQQVFFFLSLSCVSRPDDMFI